MSVLRDMQFQLDKGDVSSRPLLQKAATEDEARNWIVEQMQFRAKGRFQAYREAQIVHKDRPDIIIASTAAPCEVGMEVKHGGKNWTYKQPEHALRTQLARDYLKPASRRYGIFVVTNHTERHWNIPDISKTADFDTLMERLKVIAASIGQNDSGPIEVRSMGVNAVSPPMSPPR